MYFWHIFIAALAVKGTARSVVLCVGGLGRYAQEARGLPSQYRGSELKGRNGCLYRLVKAANKMGSSALQREPDGSGLKPKYEQQSSARRQLAWSFYAIILERLLNTGS